MSITVETRHPILACVDAMGSALDGVGGVEPLFMATDDKAHAVQALERLERRVAELRLRVLACAGDVADREGARDVACWFAHATRSDPGSARAEVELAVALERRWTRLRAAMARGAVSLAQAKVIGHALEELPADVDAATLVSAEELLVGYADQFGPGPLRRLGRRILEVLAPEIAEAEEARRLEREEQHAREKASLRLRRLGDGTTRITGLLPDPVADRLQTYLDAYTSPRHDSANTDSSQSGGPSSGQGAGVFGEADRIPAHRKRAEAFAALLEHLDPAALPEHGGDATTVLVTLSLDQLRTDLATAGLLDADLDAGANLTAAHARRLACTAKIIPVVLGGNSEILDLGRARRLYTPPQRKAIRLRDKRCRAEGCTTPATWTEVHHLQPWSHGGPTDLANGICLCHHHHHRIHDHRYTHDRLPNGDIRFHRRT